MIRSSMEDLPLSEIRVDENFWGEGAEPIVLRFLHEEYNPRTMPTLQAATINGKEGYWLMGWDHEATPWPPLLRMIFGEAYAERQLALNRLDIEMKDAIAERGRGEYGVGPGRKDDR